MKKVFALLMVCALLLCSAFASAEGELISVGIVNNPPSESGYREANVEDFEKVFSAENGYDTQTFYSLKNDEQLNAAQQFITEGVQYLLISAAGTASQMPSSPSTRGSSRIIPTNTGRRISVRVDRNTVSTMQ